MHLFYTPDITSEIYTLSAEESKHCIRVLRMRKNDTVYLTDGRGGLYKALLIADDPLTCIVKIIEKKEEHGKRNYYVHLAVAPTKNNDRFGWFLEKATEIGIDEITPMLCRRSERRKLKTERLNKIITAAMKQSFRAYHPKLNDLSDFKNIINTSGKTGRYIAHYGNGENPLLKEAYKPGDNALILIGPEGDFTEEEAEAAGISGFIRVSLGNSRLRTETAGIVACDIINMINQ